MKLVSALLRQITQTEKVVLVSNYTQTLDLIAQLLTSLSITYSRLDGGTAVAKRQNLINAFNSPADATRVFLLSSKAGGVGINLVGASRLILFDTGISIT